MGLVLAALIVIGLAGLLIRIISTESSELTLDGILPVTPDVINKVRCRVAIPSPSCFDWP